MRLLAGMRPASARPRPLVLVAGPGSAAAASALRRLEPTLDPAVVGGGASGDVASGLRAHADARADGALLLQPYHSLRSAADAAAARAALAADDAAVALVWARSPPGGQAGWVAAFEAAARAADAGARRGLLRALAPGETPMAWVDGVLGGAGGLVPFKHRKHVELVDGPGAAALAALRAAHDARFGSGAGLTGDAGDAEADAAFERGAEAARGAPPGALLLDVHCFYAFPAPLPGKAAADRAARAAAAAAAAAGADGGGGGANAADKRAAAAFAAAARPAGKKRAT